MDGLDNLRLLFKLKSVERAGRVGRRKESTAEHVWGALILSQYFLKKISMKLDEAKVMRLILYHDLAEIEMGDIFILDQKLYSMKPQKERLAFESIRKRIPTELAADYTGCFKEFDQAKTWEAKFAQAIDKLEPMIHWLDYKSDWKAYGFNETNLREKKQKYMEEFPELLDFFNDLMDYLKENKYI